MRRLFSLILLGTLTPVVTAAAPAPSSAAVPILARSARVRPDRAALWINPRKGIESGLT